MSTKTFELVRPKSLNDSSYEAFEYLIRWIGRDGAEYYYMFLDAEISHDIKSDIVNSDSEDNFQALISVISRGLRLQATDLSKNDFEVFLQLAESKYVYRIFKDATIERFVPNPSSFAYKLMDGRYQFAINLIKTDQTAWR